MCQKYSWLKVYWVTSQRDVEHEEETAKILNENAKKIQIAMETSTDIGKIPKLLFLKGNETKKESE